MPDRKPWHASSETLTCPIEDRHAWSESHWRPTCLIGDHHVLYKTDKPSSLIESSSLIIGDPSETNIPVRKPWHASSETLTCLIRDRHAWLETHWRPTCLIGDHHAFESNQNFNNIFKNSYFLILLKFIYVLGHVGFRWVSDEACRDLW